MCGGQKAVGPLLGELARLAIDDRNLGIADLKLGKSVGDRGRGHVDLAEDPGIALLDHDRGSGQPGELSHRIAQPAAGKA